MNRNETERSPEILIQSSQSLQELCENLRVVGAVKGSSQTYEAEDLIEWIEEAITKQDIKLLNKLTGTYGLRDKAMELFKK